MAQRDARSTGRESGGEESDQGVVRQPALSVEARARMRANPLDTLIRLSSERVRHATIIAATLATVLLGGIPAVLALHQYNDAKHSAVLDLQARVVALGAVVDTAFAGDIGLLETAAQSPAVQQRHLGAMNAYFRAIAASGGASFTNGIVWVDRAGRVESASRAKVLRSHASVADRGYFRQVVAADKPYISSGLIGALVREPLIAIAVPTHSANGRISGVLVGSVLLKSVRESSSALALGFGNIEVIDRAGQLLLAGLKPVSNHPLLARIRRMGVSGVVADTAGFTGNGSDAVAFALSPVPGWIVAIARPRSVLFGPATRALQLEFASVGAALLAVFAILGLIALRARRHSIGQATRARAWSGLTRSLASATSPAEVSDALLGALIAAFPRELAVVTLDGEGGARVASGARRSYAREVARDLATLDELARYGRSGAQSVPADSIGALRRLKARSERRLRSLHALPILNRGGQTVGTIAVVSPRAQREGSDWALLSSFADQSGEALERAQLFEHEHAVAVRLQRNLLPDRLPTVDAVTFAGLYHAGGLGVEVGGDWYDAVRRADGIIHLCVGDVSGRGIDAATIMGRQRSVFRAYAFECTSRRRSCAACCAIPKRTRWSPSPASASISIPEISHTPARATRHRCCSTTQLPSRAGSMPPVHPRSASPSLPISSKVTSNSTASRRSRCTPTGSWSGAVRASMRELQCSAPWSRVILRRRPTRSSRESARSSVRPTTTSHSSSQQSISRARRSRSRSTPTRP